MSTMMNDEDIPLLSLIAGLAIPELGAPKNDLRAITLAKLDEYISTVTDEAKRSAARTTREALTRWEWPELTEELTEAAQAMLVAEGHSDMRNNFRRGMAWCEVIPWINALAHPETLAKWSISAADVQSKLDEYLTYVTEEEKRAAALTMHAALVAWTSSDVPDAVKDAARAMLIVEDYEAFHADLRKHVSLPEKRS